MVKRLMKSCGWLISFHRCWFRFVLFNALRRVFFFFFTLLDVHRIKFPELLFRTAVQIEVCNNLILKNIIFLMILDSFDMLILKKNLFYYIFKQKYILKNNYR